MGPVRSGDRLCQTRLIPRSPDGDKNVNIHPAILDGMVDSVALNVFEYLKGL